MPATCDLPLRGWQPWQHGTTSGSSVVALDPAVVWVSASHTLTMLQTRCQSLSNRSHTMGQGHQLTCFIHPQLRSNGPSFNQTVPKLNQRQPMNNPICIKAKVSWQSFQLKLQFIRTCGQGPVLKALLPSKESCPDEPLTATVDFGPSIRYYQGPMGLARAHQSWGVIAPGAWRTTACHTWEAWASLWLWTQHHCKGIRPRSFPPSQ